jgi:hypothetical protein
MKASFMQWYAFKYKERKKKKSRWNLVHFEVLPYIWVFRLCWRPRELHVLGLKEVKEVGNFYVWILNISYATWESFTRWEVYLIQMGFKWKSVIEMAEKTSEWKRLVWKVKGKNAKPSKLEVNNLAIFSSHLCKKKNMVRYPKSWI